MAFPSSTKRVLLIQTGGMRDVLASLPLLVLLRTRLPRAEISVAVRESLVTTLQSHWAINRVVAVNEVWYRSYREASRLWRRLARGDAEVVFDLRGTLGSGVLAWMSGAEHRIGWSDAPGSRLFHTVSVASSETFSALRMLTLLNVLDVDGGSIHFDLPEIGFDRLVAERLHHALGLANDFVVMSVSEPNAAWSLTEHAEVVHFLKSQWNLPTLLLPDSPKATSQAETLAAISGAVTIAGGTLTLGEQASLLRLATAYIGPDTDLFHIAVALGKPTVATQADTATLPLIPSESIWTVEPSAEPSVISRWDFAAVIQQCDVCLTAISQDRQPVIAVPTTSETRREAAAA